MPDERVFLRTEGLGTEAVYRVLDERADVVLVEVVWAPGLAPGTRLELSRATVDHLRKTAAQERRPAR